MRWETMSKPAVQTSPRIAPPSGLSRRSADYLARLARFLLPPPSGLSRRSDDYEATTHHLGWERH